jgi:mono/diheme cytochrome c family protein
VIRRDLPSVLFATLLAGLLIPGPGTAADDSPVDFQRDVAPIFASRCMDCHGEEAPEGGLRLTSRQSILIRGDSGEPTVVPGEPQQSELLRRVTADEDERMPPEGEPLSPAQIDILRRWIAEGAEWPAVAGPRHWAYIAPERPALPGLTRPEWVRNAIDAFVLAKLEAQSPPLAPSPPAEPAKLLRRVYLDLIGLPPSVEDVDAFLADPSPEHYEQIVDRLLRSRRYGEKWARQWLDLARYADSNGFQADQFRQMWAYRDWVIAAMNDDMPFDRFTIEQIAGDLLPEATLEQQIATGFQRCTTCNVEAGVDPEENRVNQVIDRVNTLGTVWLGTTLECAQCHNHKYDPFTQQDYYQLFAFFNNTPLEVEQQGMGVQFEVAGPKMELPLDETQQQRRSRLTTQGERLDQQIAARKDELAAAHDAWQQALRDSLDSQPVWHEAEIGAFTSAGGATFETLDDRSLLITGPNPDKDTYTVTIETDLTKTTGIQIEALAHESLPKNGPGRSSPNPNPILNELELAVAPADAPQQTQPVGLHSATADFSQKNWEVAGAIDGDPKTGWGINPQFGKDHWARFLTAEPVGFEQGTLLTLTLHQNYGGSRTIGRLRVSLMTGDPGAGALPDDVREILALAPDKLSDKQRQRLIAYHQEADPELADLQRRRGLVDKRLAEIAPDTTLVMVEMDQPRETMIFKRGNFLEPLAKVEPTTPAALHSFAEWQRGEWQSGKDEGARVGGRVSSEADGPANAGQGSPADGLTSPPAAVPPNRLALAEWLVSPGNPLIGRVTVNRWWSEFFGEGLVATLEDFGTQGEPPTHPDLLDWLAVEFVENGWSMKHIHRLIVTSATYQQSSKVSPALLDRDPYNKLLARGPRLRLPAETIRDNALAIAGLLSTKIGGPPVYPPQPEKIWRHVGRNAPKYETDTDEDRFRRGIYVVWRRSAPYPSFVNFDAPDRGACVVNRSRTNTPLQALTLLNDPAYVEMAQALARRIETDYPDMTDRQRVEYAFRLSTARQPTSDEVQTLLELFESQRRRFADDPKSARQLAAADTAHADVSRLAAWFFVANTLLNLDETVTKE